MVCEKCQKKLKRIPTLERWKEGSTNQRRIGKNKLLEKKASSKISNCIVCKAPLPGEAKYCLRCAHERGVCALCGNKVNDRSLAGNRYKQ
jgi:hypothetical protein